MESAAVRAAVVLGGGLLLAVALAALAATTAEMRRVASPSSGDGPVAAGSLAGVLRAAQRPEPWRDRGDGAASRQPAAASAPVAPASAPAAAATATVVGAVPHEGRTASLSGRITRGGAPCRGSVELLAGPDAGLLLHADAGGAFASGPLAPGLALVRVAAGADGCTREVVLRHRRDHELSLDFGDHGAVAGRVRDADGAPLADAAVSLDGNETRTDAGGAFLLRRSASGEPLMIVRAAGHAAFRQRLDARAAAVAFDVALQRACRLELSLAPLPVGATAGANEELAHVLLLPRAGGPRSGGGTQSAFPWHLLGPLRVPPGGTLAVDDLPPCLVDVRVLHARGSGGVTALGLQAGRPARVEARLAAAPTIVGRVLHDGRPAGGVAVTLRAADATAVCAASLGEHAGQMYAQALAPAPAALQRGSSDADGRFAFGAPPGDAALYLTLRRGERVVHVRLPRPCGALELDLALLGARDAGAR